uniref:Chemokine interleukin-8-like domain-containing protein n=1 Tax=Pygocentrus nattereri TaxID=42514 RepID=A0A3B4BQT8_PYGNA
MSCCLRLCPQCICIPLLMSKTLSLSTFQDSQHVPTRCECQKSMRAVRGPFSDIKVSLKGHGCDKDEIIVTLKSNNKQMCLSPKERQGKRLLKCWLKMQKKGEDVKKCIQRLRPQKRRRQKKRT